MVDERVKAAVNLHAVLRNMEDLCAFDKDAQRLIAGKKVTLRFIVPGIEPLFLSFKDGSCEALRTGVSSSMDLRFTSPAHFIAMMNGSKNPIPTKGFKYITFLKNEFSGLAKLLEGYLRPDAARLASDDAFRAGNTILTAYTAFFALSEIGNNDETGKHCARRISDGTIGIEIKDSIAVGIRVKNGHLTTVKGRCPDAKAYMRFDSIETAGGILRGTLDSYACIGSGKLAVMGRIPMIDNLNKLLGLVPAYVA